MPTNRGYGQFCPVAKAAEIVAERWTPLILRELLVGSHRFNELQKGVPLCSPSLLSTRLKELEAAGVVQRHKSGATVEYRLTEAGEDLRPIIELLGRWGHRHVQHRIHRDDLDPTLLMWDVRRGVDAQRMPRATRTVVRFDLSGVPSAKSHWWLVFDRGEVDLCLTNPGYPSDLKVSASIRVLTEVWIGHRDLSKAIEGGDVRLEGTRAMTRAFSNWFSLSMFAAVPRDAPSASRSRARPLRRTDD